MYRELRPSQRLARYVECYWCSGDLGQNTAQRNVHGNAILPDGCADILFSTLKGEPQGLRIVGLMTAPLITSFAAACVPAVQATSVDPMQALRRE